LKLSADGDLAGDDSLANVRGNLLVERRARTGIDAHVIGALGTVMSASRAKTMGQ
jgi:hypothetical protein